MERPLYTRDFNLTSNRIQSLDQNAEIMSKVTL